MWTMDMLSLTTTCKMDLYNFPFDIQICNLTLQSLTYTEDQLQLTEDGDKDFTALESKKVFQTEGEWKLISINTTTTYSETLWINRSRSTFEITIRRRPLLYIINLIFPVFCVLVLDVVSFFIKASVAEKLGFKVTLLLASSVLLLILHDKLPSTSEKIPLIGVYCGGIFTLIGISILETIFVNFLISKGEETKSEAPAETKYAATGHDDGVDTFPMRIEEPTCTVNTQKKASLYWNRVAKIIDESFIVLYIITVIVFLSVLGKMWFHFE
ncbi:5-hydroxytryptamine receptor 3C-like [Paramisgurnus dabryanus]|uniref:5-hydroxytryptamine receptor 3C-like n=1 Tax=Paramisgurnus dabryanus TaxID=90735 RepID=UPI0031F3E438